MFLTQRAGTTLLMQHTSATESTLKVVRFIYFVDFHVFDVFATAHVYYSALAGVVYNQTVSVLSRELFLCGFLFCCSVFTECTSCDVQIKGHM